MNICHIVPIYLPGILPGCSKYIQAISDNLSERGQHVTVLTADAITGRGWVDPFFGKYSPLRDEEIKGVNVSNKRVSEFTMNMNLKAAPAADAAKAGAAKAGAAKKG